MVPRSLLQAFGHSVVLGYDFCSLLLAKLKPYENTGELVEPGLLCGCKSTLDHSTRFKPSR